MANAKGICVNILGRQHMFSCKADQEVSLIKAANDLDELLRDIKKQNGQVNNERVLLVAALNLSHQLLMANNKRDDHDQQLKTLMTTLKAAL